MNRQDFNFILPPELIAQYPLKNRSDARLLTYHRATGEHGHRVFHELSYLLNPGDLLVMNDSRVIPARLYGQKTTGGRIELLVERVIDERAFLAHIKSSKSPKPGSIIHLDEGWRIQISGRQDDLYECAVVDGHIDDLLQSIGHIPLPPYITRTDEPLDLGRYQTVYARHNGSVAAPTAGLHFDDQVLAQLKTRGIEVAYSTLHVGAGTFRPVRCTAIRDHQMHREHFTVTDALCDAVRRTRARGGRVIAVGTTALRSLESAAVAGELTACSRETDIFITPGYQFQICDGLLTNFHLPESTLLMLVSAFIGYEQAMALYQLAIKERYRFFSYGDTSLLL